MRAVLLTAIILLAGCATPPYQPVPDGYTGPIAIIEDSYTNLKKASAHYFILLQMDGQYIRHSWAQTRIDNYGQGAHFTPSIINREVLPEPKTYTIEGLVFFPTDAQMLFGNDMRVTHSFLFTPEADETYTVRGELSKEKSTVWMEDSDGNVVEGSLGVVSK